MRCARGERGHSWKCGNAEVFSLQRAQYAAFGTAQAAAERNELTLKVMNQSGHQRGEESSARVPQLMPLPPSPPQNVRTH